MGPEQNDEPDGTGRDVARSSDVDESDAVESVGAPDVDAQDPECTDPGPGRDPRPDLRGA
jgi:hypothetical protein